MCRRSRQRLGLRAVLCACAVLAAAIGRADSEGGQQAKSDVPASAEAPQPAVPPGNADDRGPADNRQIVPASARPAPSTTDTRIVAKVRQRPTRPAITLDDAAAIVRQSYGGNVVHRDAAPQPASDDARYRIRVDVDGRVKTVFVDPAGRILRPPPPRPQANDASADH